jgi:hypothetical protein
MWSSQWISFIADYSENLKTGSDPRCELNGESNTKHFLMAAAAFIFQILLSGSNDLNQSIVVEVAPTSMPGATLGGDKAQTERGAAEETARQVAGEVLQAGGGFALGVNDSVAQIGSLPEEIREKPPTLQRGGVRAWLL